MTEFNTKELSGMLQVALHINSSNLEKMDRQEDFINYIKKHYSKIFNEANDYAYDEQKKIKK